MGTLVWGTAGTISGLQNNQQGNAIAAALAGLSQGATPPSPASTGLVSTAGLLWHDTAANQLKLRNQADTAWIALGQVDEANGLFLPVCQASALPALLRGLIGGLGLANDGAFPNTRIDVAAGVCADDTAQAVMSLAAGAVDFATAGPDGLDTGAIAAGTWYHIFAIMKGDGTTKRLASASLAPALPAGYVYKRRLGSVKTDATAHLLPFFQKGDWFIWRTPVLDVSTNTLGTASTAFTLPSVPPGVNVNAQVVIEGWHTTVANVSFGVQPGVANGLSLPTIGIAVQQESTNFGQGIVCTILTDTSQRIMMAASLAASSLKVTTSGWEDWRGKFD
jgi:hypothetical protein